MAAAVEEIERIVGNASRTGVLGDKDEEVLQEFLNDFERRARGLYDGALAITSQTYDREHIAKFWKGHRESFEAQLVVATRMERKLRNVPTELDLSSLITTLENLIDACSEHYEFHA